MSEDGEATKRTGQLGRRRRSGDPEVVRDRLAAYPRGPWWVYETLAADGSKAIGISPVPLARSAAIIVYDGLAEEVARLAAIGLADWYGLGATR